MSLEISSLCFMHVYYSDPLSHASMCFPMRLPLSFHGYLLGKVVVHVVIPTWRPPHGFLWAFFREVIPLCLSPLTSL